MRPSARLLLIAAVGFIASPAAAKNMTFPKSVKVVLPPGLDPYSGPGADAINRNCLACHSRDMVLNQPNMSKAAWEAEVAKMHNVYKAPIVQADVPEIVDYLVKTKGAK